MNAQREAYDRLNGAYDVRVLESSPPAVTDAPYFADDPTARDDGPAAPGAEGKPIVSPVTTGDVTWDELCRDDPSLARWCAPRWLGAWRRLPPVPARAVLTSTRRSWHAAAEHVLAPARHAANGRIGLRFARGGFATPWYRAVDGTDRQLRVEGNEIVVHDGGGTARRAPLTTLGAAGRAAGVVPGAPRSVYEPATAPELDAPCDLDAGALELLAAWFGLGASVLEQLRAEATPSDAPARVQLWPEHFDLSVDLGDEGADARGTFGASPGDAEHAEPYLYVTHWGAARDDDFWNDTTFDGASLGIEALVAVDEQRDTALAFFRRGVEVLRANAAR